MTTLQFKTVNAETGEETIRDFTDEEVKEFENAKTQREFEQAVKDAAKQAVLDKLGLSSDEIAALLG